MKLLFILLIFISSSLSYADAKPIEIKLSLNLELRQLCNNSSPFCTVEGKVFLGGTKIILKPVLETMCQSNGDGTTTCSSPELCESGDENCPQPSHYRGLWSTVVETGGERAFAIVSVDRRSFSFGGQDKISYFFTIEILNNEGVSAKLTLSTPTIKDLGYTTLYGNVYTSGMQRYQAELSIGPSYLDDLCPVGGKDCENNRLPDQTEKTLIKGFLK